jgi:hypothetical protein
MHPLQNRERLGEIGLFSGVEGKRNAQTDILSDQSIKLIPPAVLLGNLPLEPDNMLKDIKALLELGLAEVQFFHESIKDVRIERLPINLAFLLVHKQTQPFEQYLLGL